ncbi:NAD(P)H-binding protein [Companilactobacillus keshanensis]|uniref:NAD(P)H-binding protein n=1 Tax=Companilactobacillus keshanensis TaxID=2486003 RepID=A0ABW4BWU8_9LACO|nr:NAD(P)H-binding protein [Companilactobacillus keshanensis]
MENVLIIGASGSIGSLVRQKLLETDDSHLTLFVRNIERLGEIDDNRETAVAGDANNINDLNKVVEDQDVVFVAVNNQLPEIAQKVVEAMDQNKVGRLVFVTSMGIYNEVSSNGYSDDIPNVLVPYRKAADIIEDSDIEYTLLRPGWFDDDPDINYQITFKGEAFVGHAVSRGSVADLASRIINEPTLYMNESLGLARA